MIAHTISAAPLATAAAIGGPPTPWPVLDGDITTDPVLPPARRRRRPTPGAFGSPTGLRRCKHIPKHKGHC